MLLRRHKIFIILILLIVHLGLKGQNTIGLPLIVNYDKTEYKGGAQTWAIAQDEAGILYFANNEGLLTFDGTYWKKFPIPNHTIIRSLAISPDRKIYIGGQGEIGYFQADQNGLLRYHSLKNQINPRYSTFADVWKIEIHNGAVFFQASDRLFIWEKKKMSVFLPKSEWQFMGKTDNTIFASDRNDGVFLYKNGVWVPVVNNHLLRDAMITGACKSAAGEFLLTTRRSGVFALRKDTLRKIQQTKFADFGAVNAADAINGNQFVAGTRTGGCIIGDFAGNTIQRIGKNEGLQNNNVLCVFVDRDENIWAGLTNGISFIGYSSTVKFVNPNPGNELPAYSSLIYDGKLYIATSNGAYVTPVDKLQTDLSFSKSQFKLVENSDGEVWKAQIVNGKLLLGYNDGILQVDGARARPVAGETGVWLFRPLESILPAKHILAGTYTGLQLLNSSSGELRDGGAIEGLHESFRFIEVDNHGRIWASHPYRGIYRIMLTPDMKSFTTKLYNSKNGLPSDLDNFVFKPGSQVVFATKQGIYEFDPQQEKFVPSKLFKDIFGSMPVRYLKEDENKNIWFCSDKMIGVAMPAGGASPASYRLLMIPELTGQILSGFENVFPYNDENIFIGSEKGAIHFNLKKYIANRNRPKVLLSEVTTGSSDSILFSSYLGSTQTRGSGIHKLPAGLRSFHFAYSSPRYGANNNVEYSYQLQGYDQDWSPWSGKTEKNYTNLPAGTYVFHVKAKGSLGMESAVSTWSFEVAPFWYETTFARALYVIAFLFIVFLFYRQHKLKLYKQKVRYEEEQKRLNEIHRLKIEMSEKEIIKLQNEKLENEIRFKRQELADANLHLEERSGALVKVKEKLETLYEKTDQGLEVKKALQILKEYEKNNANWDQFVTIFDDINNDFLKRLKQQYPALTKTDLKLCVYVQGNLSSKEIAQIMNISVRGVEIARYRLRKKLQLDTSVNLNDFLVSFGD